MDCLHVSRDGSTPHESTRGYVVVIVRIDPNSVPDWEPTDPGEVPLFAVERTQERSGIFASREQAERFAAAHNGARLSSEEHPGELWAIVEHAPETPRNQLAVLIMRDGQPVRTTWIPDPRAEFCEQFERDGCQAIPIDASSEAFQPFRVMIRCRKTGKVDVIELDDPRPSTVYHMSTLGYDAFPLA